jgi:hypothetical protein
MCSAEIDLAIIAFLPFLSQISVEIHRQRCTRKGKCSKSVWLDSWLLGSMTRSFRRVLSFFSRHWYWEDRNHELEAWGPPPRQWAPVYDGASCGLTDPSSTTISTSDSVCSGLNPYAMSYYLAVMISQDTRSGHLSSSPPLKHRAPLH